MSSKKTPAQYASAILIPLVNFDLYGDMSATDELECKTHAEFLKPVMRDLLASHLVQERKRGVSSFTVTRDFAEFWLSETLDSLILVRPDLTILTEALAETEAVREALLSQATYRMMIEMRNVLGYIKRHPEVSEIYLPKRQVLDDEDELKDWASRQERRA